MARRKISFEGLASLPFEEWEDEIQVPSRGGRQNPYKNIEIEKTDTVKETSSDRLLYFFSMGSGSSGNSCYIGTSSGGIIIDAGVRADEIESMIRANGIGMDHVKGILLTHDHADHVKYAYTLVRNNKHLKIFCTNRVLNGVLRRHNISKRIKDYHVPIFKEIPFKIGGLEITAFEVPHDGTDNMGFSIEFDGRHFVLATDMGEVSPRARHYITNANYLVMESNYDLRMLRDGKYPEYLKARIQTSFGHMDNAHTAHFLQEIISERLSHIFLCHLSKDKNTPDIALRTVREALESVGKTVGKAENSIEDRKADLQLMALPRYGATRLFVFRPLVGARS